MTISAFVGTNPTGELITSGLPVTEALPPGWRAVYCGRQTLEEFALVSVHVVPQIGRYASGALSVGRARSLVLTQFRRRRPVLSGYCLPLVVRFRFVLAAARSHFAPSSVATAAAIHKKPAALLGPALLYALDIV
jgi:hypothetical protein